MRQLLLTFSLAFILGCAEAADPCEMAVEDVIALNCPGDAGVNCLDGLLVLTCNGEATATGIDCTVAEDGYPMPEFNDCSR